MIRIMLILLAMLAQATTDTAASATAGPLAPPPRCRGGASADGDVVVCGRVDDEGFRLRPVPERYHANTGPGFGFKFGDVTGNAYVAQEKTIDGKPDKRIMVTLKTPF